MLREQKQRQSNNKAKREGLRKWQREHPKSNQRHCSKCGGNYMDGDYHACR